MAQVQLVRPNIKQAQKQKAQQAEAKVEVEQKIGLQQVVQQKQSLQMVQTLLGASIGSLAYIRRLFPDKCFTKMLYTHDIAEDYEKFCKAPEVDSREPGTKITRLQRGATNEADVFLDWLEKGVFRAVNVGYLKAMQVYITSEKDQTDSVIESYTFSFSYLGNRVSLSLGGHNVTMENACQSARSVTRRLLSVTEDLTPLPELPWLAVQLQYADNTPDGYNAPGFKRLNVSAPGLIIRGSDIARYNCGSMNSGYHGVSLRVSSLHDKPEGPASRRGRRAGSRFFVDEDVEEPTVGSLEPFNKRPTTDKQEDITIPISNSQNSSDGGQNDMPFLSTQPVLGVRAAPSEGLSLRLS